MTSTELNTPELRLPRPPGVFRRWLAAHPRVVDLTIVVTYLFGCAMMIVFELISGYAVDNSDEIEPAAAEQLAAVGVHMQWPWALVSGAVVLLTALALAYRRRFPLAGLLLVSGLLFFEQGLLVLPNSVAVVFLLYAVPVYRSVAAGWIGLSITVALNAALTILSGTSTTGVISPLGIVVSDEPDLRTSISLAVANSLWMLAVLLIAINLGNRRRYIEALIDRAHQLATEREQRAQLAAAAERSRIAREMHDIVAHSLSVVVTLSEAASVAVHTQPEASRNAMERAAETGRSALMEMRRLLGVLGDGAEPLASADPLPETESANERTATAVSMRAPQPGVAQIPELVDGFRQTGLRVELTESGVPGSDATQQLAVYRIVQEALTNSLRYAGKTASVVVTIAHSDAGTDIEVVDRGKVSSGSEQPSAAIIPGSGRGLAGAAERARLFGGSLTAGQYRGGWRVIAHLPASAKKHQIEGAHS